jgi:hypothetical protein
VDPFHALPFVAAIIVAICGLALASYSSQSYEIGLAVFGLATGYGFWSEELYFDKREQQKGRREMPRTPAPKIKFKRAELLQVYGEAGQCDRHYSTVRATVCVFLLTASMGLSAFVLQSSNILPSAAASSSTSVPKWIGWIIVILALVLLALANLVNLYFQRCSFSCQQLQEGIEKLLAGADDTTGQFIFVGFRTGFEEEYWKADFGFHEQI